MEMRRNNQSQAIIPNLSYRFRV